MFPTLYVGKHEHGLFAVPSLVDKETCLISPAGYLPLATSGSDTDQERECDSHSFRKS